MDNNYTNEENIEKREETNGESGEYFEIKIPLHLFQYLSAENCDLQDLCRICLSLENEVMFPLWPTKDNHLLADMFKDVTAIPVDEGDGLPSNICPSCQAQVVNCYDFKALCEKSNYTLISILKGEFTAKDEVIECDVPPQGSNQQMLKKDTQLDQDNVKKEEDVEDIQYLEDFGDLPNESYTLNSSTEDIKTVQKITEAVYVADPNSMSDEVGSYVTSSKNRRKSHTCSFCGKNYLKLKALRAHIKNSHKSSEQPYPCNQCKDAFNSEHDLKLHMALHTKGTTWKCNKCEKEFHTKAMLRRHIQRHMECKRYACETCGKLFIELYALRRHTRVHTGEIIEKKHACNLCDKRFRSMSQLLSHVARHEGARPCACACGKAFPTPRLLASHARVHSDNKPHACLYCDKRFRHESTRNTHHRTHTGEKPYVCCTCGKTFIQNSNLTLHMRTHTGEKPYSCALCRRQFSSSSTLKAHARSHTGERPYQCNICGKKFARMSLKCHMRLHTGERPFQCSVCPKSFVNASRLKEHAHVHTGEKPFECAMCAQTFPTKSHLVKHLKSHQPQKKSKRVVMCNPEILVSNKIVIAEKSSTIEGLKAKTVRAEETGCRIVILDSEQAPLEVHLSC